MRHLDYESWTMAAEVLDYRIAFDRKLAGDLNPPSWSHSRSHGASRGALGHRELRCPVLFLQIDA